MLATGQIVDLLIVSVTIGAIFAIVGVFHFGIARQLSYISIKNIGANEASPIISSQVLYSLLFAVLLLNEKMTLSIAGGAGLILIGILVLERRAGALKRRGNLTIGIVAALLTGSVYGLTPILIKYGLSIYHFFVAATFVAYACSFAVYVVSTNPVKMVGEIKALPRLDFAYFCIAGLFSISAQLLRFGALSFAPVVLVAPILSTHPIFTVLLTRKLAREFESFQTRILFSIALVVLGSFLVSYSSGIAG